MEQQPQNYNISDMEKLASDIYDDVDWLFTRRNVPSLYEKGGFHDRYCLLQLTAEELERVGPILFNYAIDPPNFVEITLKGRNPRIYTDTPRGGVEFKMTYESSRYQHDIIVTTNYSFVLENTHSNSVSVLKDMTGRPKPYGRHAGPTEINHVYFGATPATRDEQRALRAITNVL